METTGMWEKKRRAAVDWRLALALALTYYVAGALAAVAHELGHGLAGELLGGEFSGWYVAPGVVSWSRPFGDVPLPRGAIAWITAAGAIAEGLLGGSALAAAALVRRRWRNWLPAGLALGGALVVTQAGVNLASNVALGWGDGYALIQWGVSPLVPLGAGLLAVALLGWVELPFVARTLEPYVHVARGVDAWASIVAAGLPPLMVSLVKSFLFFPDHYARYGVYLPAFALVGGIGAALAGWGRRLDRSGDGPVERVPLAAVAILAALALAIEAGFTAYFGLGQAMKPPPF